MAKKKNGRKQNNNNKTIQVNTLSEMPNEILITGIIPHLPVGSLPNLLQASKRFYGLKDDTRIKNLYQFFNLFASTLSNDEHRDFSASKVFEHDFEKINADFLKITKNQTKETLDAKDKLLLFILTNSHKKLTDLLENINFSIFFQTDKQLSPFSLAASVGNIQIICQLIEYEIKRVIKNNKILCPSIRLEDIDNQEEWKKIEKKQVAYTNIIIGTQRISIIEYYKQNDYSRYISLLQNYLNTNNRSDRESIFVNSIYIALQNKHFELAKFFLVLNVITTKHSYEILHTIITNSYNEELYKICLQNIKTSNHSDKQQEYLALKFIISSSRTEIFENTCTAFKGVFKDKSVFLDLLTTAILCANNEILNCLVIFIADEEILFNFSDAEIKRIIIAAMKNDNVQTFISATSILDNDDSEEFLQIAIDERKENIQNYLQSSYEENDPNNMEIDSFRT